MGYIPHLLLEKTADFVPSFAQIAALEKMPFDEPGVARRAYSDYIEENATKEV